MSIFAIVLHEANPEVAERIDSQYPGNFAYNDTFYLVNSSSISATIALNIGLKGDDRIDESSGVVFKLNDSFSGFTKRSLWEWLSSVEGLDRKTLH